MLHTYSSGMASLSVLQTSTTTASGLKVRPPPLTSSFFPFILLFWSELKDHNTPEITKGTSLS